MPWPPVLPTPSSTLDIIFYVRGGKFHVSVRHSLTKSRRSATERVGPLPAPVVIEHRLPDKSRCRDGVLYNTGRHGSGSPFWA